MCPEINCYRYPGTAAFEPQTEVGTPDPGSDIVLTEKKVFFDHFEPFESRITTEAYSVKLAYAIAINWKIGGNARHKNDNITHKCDVITHK